MTISFQRVYRTIRAETKPIAVNSRPRRLNGRRLEARYAPRMVSQRRITQIIAADGWLAVYNLGSGDVSDIRTRPLVCWALVEDATGSQVVGLDADTAAGDRAPGLFLGYVKEGESLERFRK